MGCEQTLDSASQTQTQSNDNISHAHNLAKVNCVKKSTVENLSSLFDNCNCTHHVLKRVWHTIRIPLLIVLLISAFECTLGNIQFWSSISASTDSAFAHNTLGSGVTRLKTGGLLITDPTEAYLEVVSDGSSPYIRLQRSIKEPAKNSKYNITCDIHVRIDVNKYAGKPLHANPCILDEALLPMPPKSRGATNTLRVWLEHPAGTVLDIEDVRANARAQFTWSWLRVTILALISIMLALWNPWSRLWSMPLNTRSRKQRFALVASWIPSIVITIAVIIWSIQAATRMRFYIPGNYTYDFDQYAHTADALLHGKTHLMLPVPKELTQLSNPYDPAARNELLKNGVSNIYWDYAYYNGHWYSYFGLLPAVLLFLPYQLISQIWVPGGAMLPTSAATLVFLTFFFIAGSLLVIRLLQKTVKNPSLALVTLSLTFFFIASNTSYLLFRTSFYSVPMAASLAFTSFGLWFYCGAIREEDNNLSLKRLALGSFFIALNIGCRPTFAIAILLAIPLIYKRVLSCVINIFNHTKVAYNLSKLLRLLCAWIMPVVLTAIPFGIYNMLRFGSPLNFGNEYQITITDMTTMKLPKSNIIPSILSYLALPLRFIPTFPWIGIQPIAFDRWQYAEPMIGGLFALCPLVFIGVVAALIMRKNYKSKISYFYSALYVFAGIILVIFDSLKAGIGWRYIADFAWSFALAAVIGIAVIVQKYATLSDEDTIIKKIFVYALRAVILAFLFFSIAINFLSWFVTGREDSMIRFYPSLWHIAKNLFTFMY